MTEHDLKPPQEALDALDIVIVGGTGSLAKLKLLPALYDLLAEDLMPGAGRIIGMARTGMSREDYRDLARQAIQRNARNAFRNEIWASLQERLDFIQLDDDGYIKLKQAMRERERLVYLAIPPSAFGPTVRALAEVDLVEGTRLLVEKPFGRDLESAIALDRELHEVLDESQVYRIDHYLGKETVQNILVFRFGNSLFERVWDRDAIDHIEITVAESEGVDGRGNFYEEVGALRDIVQNHLLQILSVLTMEPPASFDAEAIRDEKNKLLRAIKPLEPKNVVRGQYTAGAVNGRTVRAYRDEEGVDPASGIETFIAARVEIENWRWAGVPIYLRTGKRLPYKATEIEIAFRDVPRLYFEEAEVEQLEPNTLTLCIQPDEKITLSFIAKVPSPSIRVKPVLMNFSYEDSFSREAAEAYQRLIHDAMAGDQTLFVRADSVERAWHIVQPILDNPSPLHEYAAGTWGPTAAEELIAPLQWHLR